MIFSSSQPRPIGSSDGRVTLKALLAGFAVALIYSGSAVSQTCATYPNTLTNGAPADANQVMANFNCAALLGSAHFTGKVGIGTASPGSPLTVQGASSWGVGQIIGAGTNAESDIGFHSSNIPNGGAGDWLIGSNIGSAPTGAFTIWDGALGNVLTITTGGAFGVGNVSPANSLDISDNHGTLPPTSGTSQAGSILTETGDVGLTLGIDNTSPYAGWIQVANISALNVDYDLLLNPNGGTVGIGTSTPNSSYILYVNGAAAGTSAWTVVSDARLKDHVTDLKNGIATVAKLRPVRFDWKPVEKRKVGKDLKLAVGEPQIGFIAQEVEKVLPEAVTVPRNGSSDPYVLQETKLIPLLVAAVKEQQDEIKAQQTKIVELSAEIMNLKEKVGGAPAR
jgi:hypothetical protein